MTDSASIHVALTFDDRYWAPAYATMRSVCVNTKRRKDLVFHLFHRPLSAEHADTLRRIESEFGATLDFHLIDADSRFTTLMETAPYNTRLSNIVYARLLFGDVLADDFDRLIYLDCDMMVRVPIERLAEMDMQGKPLAAAPDYIGQFIMTGRNLVDKRGIFDPASRYFNAGLLVIDMPKWRAMNVMGRFNDMMASGVMQKIYYDQDFLNLAFADNWLELHQYWNFIDPKRLHEQLNPYLLHYTGPNKPWLLRTKAPFRVLYRYTMTNDVYYRYLAERSPKWLRPLVMWVKRMNGD